MEMAIVISNEEKQRRLEAVRYATASTELSGLTVPADDSEYHKNTELFLAGEIDFDELTARTLEWGRRFVAGER